MRKVILSMEAQEKYEIIKSTAEGHITKHTASIKIGCTKRHVNRLLCNYSKVGKSSFIHGNKGRKPVHALSNQQKTDIITIYNNKYWDTNFTHCCELLEKLDSIKISPSSLRKLLYSEFILSPRANRSTRKHLNKLLSSMQKTAKTKNQKTLIKASIVAIEDAHSRRSRCAYFGEMLQMDASVHLWFGD